MSLTVIGGQASTVGKHSISSSLTAIESFQCLLVPAESKAGNDRDAGEPANDRHADDDRHADEAGNDRDADEVGTDQDADKQAKQTESPPVRGERVIVCL